MLNANKFWANQGDIVEIRDSPGAISNGFLLDFKADDIWIELNPEPNRSVESLPFCLAGCDKPLIVQSEGRTEDAVLAGEYGLYVYELVTLPFERTCRVQKPLVEYFLRRYPSCSFWFQHNDMPIAVKVDGEIVGALMPIVSRVRYFPKKPLWRLE